MANSPELWDAFADAIDAGTAPPMDDNGRPILDQPDPNGGVWPRYYRGKTKPNTAGALPPPGYFLFGMDAETELGIYNGEAGQDGLYRFGCWAREPDDAKALYRWVKPLLHRVPLIVPGYEPVAGILSKTGPFTDTDGKSWQVLASYQAEPMEAAA